MSTSDEEDNDSDPDIDDDITKKPPPKPKDVVRTLIERDDNLMTRDLQCRMLKIQIWKKNRKRFGCLNDAYDNNEDFSWIH